MIGLIESLMKSNIYITRIIVSYRRDILEITGFVLGHLAFRYLGNPLASRKLRTLDYSFFGDAIATKINSWPRHSLLYAGKIELIRSVLQGVKCFWLSILRFPSNIIHDIYKMCQKFVFPTKHPPIL